MSITMPFDDKSLSFISVNSTISTSVYDRQEENTNRTRRIKARFIKVSNMGILKRPDATQHQATKEKYINYSFISIFTSIVSSPSPSVMIFLCFFHVLPFLQLDFFEQPDLS